MFAIGEKVVVIKPKGVTGISYGEWDFDTHIPIPGKIIDKSSIYKERFGYEYCVLGLDKQGNKSQWVPASALAKMSFADDKLEDWL